MPNPVAASIGVSIGGSLLSSRASSRSASRAASAQVNAANLGIDEQRRQFDEIQKRLSPFVDGGNAAFSEMLALAGLAPEPQAITAIAEPVSGYGDDSFSQMLANAARNHNAVVSKYASATGAPVIDNTGALVEPGTAPTALQAQEAAMGRIANDPRLLYQMQQAEEALLANAAATGGVRGGNTAGMLAELRPALFSQAIDRRYAELGNIASMGQSSAAMSANAGQSFANNATNLYGQIGAAQAGGALGGAAAFNQGLGGVSQALGTAFGQFQMPQGASLFDQWGF